jgi:protein-S-isoprenylcysteine O-methyltransferase Ste14
MALERNRLLQRVRVPLGFVFAVLFFVFARPTTTTLVMGGLVALVGLAIRAWASGHIRKAKTLAISGPYSRTRNPLYVGTFVLGIGFTIATGVWWLGLLFTVLFLGIYLPVMHVEAEDLRRIFGSEFEEYERNVPLFLPRLTVWRNTAVGFDPKLYLQYREYRAAVGALAAVILLAAKAYFLG